MHLVLQNVWQMHESFKNTVQLHIMQRSRKTYALCMKINLAEINSKRTVLSYTKCNYVIWRSNVSTLGLQFSNCARTLEKLMCASGRRHQDLSIAGPCAFWGRRESDYVKVLVRPRTYSVLNACTMHVVLMLRRFWYITLYRYSEFVFFKIFSCICMAIYDLSD